MPSPTLFAFFLPRSIPLLLRGGPAPASSVRPIVASARNGSFRCSRPYQRGTRLPRSFELSFREFSARIVEHQPVLYTLVLRTRRLVRPVPPMSGCSSVRHSRTAWFESKLRYLLCESIFRFLLTRPRLFNEQALQAFPAKQRCWKYQPRLHIFLFVAVPQVFALVFRRMDAH